MWKPGRKGSDFEAITPKELPEIWGVEEPHQIIDLLGLMGDASDNIPGVPGIGPKTAVKLIAQFGSVEELLKNTDKLKGKQKENVENNKENALLSKDLATIIRDAPLDVSFDDLVLSPYDEEEIQKIFTEYEFRSLATRLFGKSKSVRGPVCAKQRRSRNPCPHSQNPCRHQSQTTSSSTPPPSKKTSSPPSKLPKATASISKPPPSTASNPKSSASPFALETGTAYYLPYNRVHHARLQELFSQPAEKIGHNLKFDLHILNSHKITVAGPFFDTMIVHALLYPEQRHTMDRLAENLLSYQTIKLSDLAEKAQQEAEAKKAKEASEDDLFSLADDKEREEENRFQKGRDRHEGHPPRSPCRIRRRGCRRHPSTGPSSSPFVR